MPAYFSRGYFCQVKWLPVFVLWLLPFSVFTQIRITGVVVDSMSGKILTPVSIENANQHNGVVTDAEGKFEINAKDGESIVFSHVGYKNYILRVRPELSLQTLRIKLSLKPVQLKEVKINKGPTEYQKDSASRASLYEDAFTYKQSKSVMSPVTSLYQVFSKKHKAMRHFQDQIEAMELEKFVDSRYTPELVMSLLKINQEEAAAFMKAYPMEYDYARGASDLEIKMWIKYNYKLYKK